MVFRRIHGPRYGADIPDWTPVERNVSAAAGSVDTDLGFLSRLELYRADVPDGRVPTPGVVEVLDVVEHA